MVNDKFIKSKFNYVFILIIFAEMYFLKGSTRYPDLSSIDVYASGLFNLYNKGIFILIFLLMLYLLVSDFDKNIVLLRYKSLDLWARDLFNEIIKSSTFMVIIINVIPVIFTVFSTNCTGRDLIVMSIYVINQLAAFCILAFIYILLFVINRNKMYNLIGMFFVLFVPKYLLDAFRKNYITPINFIFFNSDTTLVNMLIQTNIMIILASVVIYLIQCGIFKNKYKDIVWRN